MRLPAGVLALILTVLVVAAACADERTSPADRSGTPASLEGVIVDIDSRGFGDVRSFDLKAGDEIYTIEVDPDLDYGFPLGHLRDHMVGALPVIVRLDERDGDLIALEIADA